MVADAVNPGVAEADCLTLVVGSQRDLGWKRKRVAEVGAVNPFTQLRIVDIDKTGALRVSIQVVTHVGATKQLLLQGAFQSLALTLSSTAPKRRQPTAVTTNAITATFEFDAKPESCDHEPRMC